MNNLTNKTYADYLIGFETKNIRRALLGLKKNSRRYKEIMSGYNAAKRQRQMVGAA